MATARHRGRTAARSVRSVPAAATADVKTGDALTITTFNVLAPCYRRVKQEDGSTVMEWRLALRGRRRKGCCPCRHVPRGVLREADERPAREEAPRGLVHVGKGADAHAALGGALAQVADLR